jgi:hypothetical protein
MTTYDLTKKTHASTGQTLMLSPQELRVKNLESKVTSQSEKLEHIVKLLNELSEKKSTS